MELLKCTRTWSRTLPVGTVLAAAIHVYGCQLDELRPPGYRQQCIICFHSCVYVIMQYFVIFDCTLLENKLTTTTTVLCIAMIYIDINGMHCHKSYVWWIEQFVQQPFRCDCRYILRILENITPDAGLALVVHEPSIMQHNIPYRAYICPWRKTLPFQRIWIGTLVDNPWYQRKYKF